MSLKAKVGFVSFSVIFTVSCSQFAYKDDRATYYDSAFNDHNRAPAFLTPPSVADTSGQTLDPLYMKTQADYNYALGETYSFEGNHEKSAEAFKTVLLYDASTSDVHLRLATEYVKLNMLTEAISETQSALEKNPSNVEAHVLLGGLYTNLKLYPKAIFQYQTALKLDSDNAEAYLYIGAILAEQKKYKEAITYFQKLAANENYSTPHLAYYYIGKIYLDSHQTAKAEASFLKALEVKPNHEDSVLALGRLYRGDKKENKEINLYEAFLDKQGTYPEVVQTLVDIYLQREDYDLAYQHLLTVENLSDDNLNTKIKMALILIQEKKLDPAAEKLKEVLTMVPESDKIRFYLAAVYEEGKKTNLAVENYMKVPTDSNYYAESVIHASYLLKAKGDLGEAIETANKGLTARKDLPELYSLAASLTDEKGEHKKALGILKDGVRQFPDNPQLYFFVGTVNDKLGHKDEVISAMKKVISLDPKHAQALNYLSFTYADMGTHLDEAETLARKALALEPQDGYILDTLGWVLFKKGSSNEAIRVLEKAYSKQPSESSIAEHLGDAYLKIQLVQKAKEMYEKAVESEPDNKKASGIRAKITAIDKPVLIGAPNNARLPASVDESQ